MRWVLTVVALLVGFAVGILVPYERDEPTSPAEPVAMSVVQKKIFTELERIESSAEAPNVEELEALLEDSDVDEGWLDKLSALDSFDQIGVLHARLSGVSRDDFPLLMDTIGSAQNSAISWQVRGMIATRWAQVDPQGMLAYTRSQNDMHSWGLYSAVFSAWAKQNPQAAYSAALNMDTRRSRDASMQAVINTLAGENPQQAIEIATDYYGSGLNGRGRWVFQSIYRNWAQVDGAAARQSALMLDEGKMKSAALAGAMSDWMADDPMEALNWLDSLPMDSGVFASRKEVFRNLLNRDFDVAKEYIESVENPFDRRQIVENLQMDNLSWQKSFDEIESVFDWLGTVSTGQTYDNRVSAVIGAMADRDSDRAVDFVLNMRPGHARMNALNTIGGKLVEIDPVRAFEFVDSLHHEDEKRRALGSMGWRLSQNGIEGASAHIANSQDPLVQRQLASRISAEWSQYDQAAALAWSESLTDEQARKSAVRSVVNKWIQANPSEALTYVKGLPEGADQTQVLRDAYSSWARHDPQAAVAGLSQLPDGLSEGREKNIYQSVARSFIDHDPMEASQWISTLEDGVARDQVVETLVLTIHRTDPEAGFLWASTVGDAQIRNSSLRQTIQTWAKEDVDAAYEALIDAEISAEEKVPLLEIVEGKR